MKRGGRSDIGLGEPPASQLESQDVEIMDVDEGLSSQILAYLSLELEFVPH